MISAGGNLINLGEDLKEGGLELWLDRWQCVFAIDTGIFYISFLIAVGLFKNILQLHRLGDWMFEHFTSLIHSCSAAEAKVAKMLAREAAANRSGNRLSLADDYVWLVFHTTVLFFFCFTCPLITPIYGCSALWPLGPGRRGARRGARGGRKT